jgi:hypothetical protein
MTSTTAPLSPTRRRAALSVAACAAVLLAGCSAQEPTSDGAAATTTGARAQQWTPGTDTAEVAPPSTARTLPPEAAGVDRTCPDATARAALTVWFGWNTNTDRGPNDAAARATPLLSPRLVDAVTSTTSVTGPGAQWNQWAAKHATLTAEVAASPELVPEETATEAYRVFVVTQTARTPDGTEAGTRSTTANVLLRHTADGWEVDKISER